MFSGSNPAGDTLLGQGILLPHTTTELGKYVIYNPPTNAPVTTRIGPVVAVLQRFHGYVLLQTVALTHLLWVRWSSLPTECENEVTLICYKKDWVLNSPLAAPIPYVHA